MALRLLFFAQSAQWAARRELTLPCKGRTTIAGLLESRPELRPLQPYLGVLRAAVNEKLTDFEQEVDDGDEIAFLPPVSGG